MSAFDSIGGQTLDDVIAYHGKARGEHTFLVHEDTEGRSSELSYAELDATTRSVGTALLESGLHPGDRVLLMAPNTVGGIVTMLGCARVGLVSVPVNTGYVAPEVRHVVELVEPRAFVASGNHADAVVAAFEGVDTCLRVTLDGSGSATGGLTRFEELMSRPPTPPAVRVESEDLLQLIMTSGTTARPKAVMRTHANCLWSAYRFAMQARLTPADRNITALPSFHVNCLDQTLFSSLVTGATVVLLERYSATRYMEQVRRHRATVISVVPMLVRTLLAQPPLPEDREHHVRLAIGGLQLTLDEMNSFQERFGLDLPILGGYGLTEASTNVTLTVLGGDPRWPSIGLPAIDRTIMLVDETGASVGSGEVGEVIVQGVPGRSLMKGYWRDDEATAAALRDGWLYTGDLARRDDDGYFHFVDRKKDMIKVSGENVAALEVEQAILEHDAVAEVAVIGVPDPLRDEAVKAVLVLKDGADLELEALQSHCAARLARFKVPTQLELVDDLPRTSIGKIDKGTLRGREKVERS